MDSSDPPPDTYDISIARARAASAALGRVAHDLSRVRIGANADTDADTDLMTAAQLLDRLNEDLNQ